jgi:hypothetical protein
VRDHEEVEEINRAHVQPLLVATIFSTSRQTVPACSRVYASAGSLLLIDDARLIVGVRFRRRRIGHLADPGALALLLVGPGVAEDAGPVGEELAEEQRKLVLQRHLAEVDVLQRRPTRDLRGVADVFDR